jgi:redox-regulated HSP33 family molecular chaperone
MVEITDIKAPFEMVCDFCGETYWYDFACDFIQTKAYL